MIPLSVPTIRGNEWEYVKKCLDTEWISSVGEFVNTFETKICEYTGAKYAIAVVNGTAALHVSLHIIGVKKHDEVIVPTLTFIATINAIRYLDADPVFMDCDKYYNIDVEKTIEYLKNETVYRDGYTFSRKTNKRISAIIPVHAHGNAAELEQLLTICKNRNIKIVEDACESIGTFYTKGILKNKHTGTVGDIGCYSFNGNKLITTGGGGMIVTNNQDYAEKARYLTTQAKNDPIMFIHNEIGYNYRLTNVQAAIGVAQLEQLPEYLKIKKTNYKLYKNEIDKIKGLHLAETPDYANNNYWMHSLQINKNIYGKDRNKLMEYLNKKGIQTRPIWYLNHMQEPYIDCDNYKIERAFKLLNMTLNIPCSISIKKEEIFKVISFLRG